MSDNKDLQGKQDRERVACNEDYELRYLAGKHDVSVEDVKDAIASVGNNRDDIEKYFKSKQSKQ